MGAALQLTLSDEEVKAFWEPRLRGIGRSLDIDLTLGEGGLVYDTLLKLWDRRMERTPDAICLETLGTKLSFRDVDEASDAVACYLLGDSRLKAGDVVGIIMPNISQYIVTMLGAMKAGLIVSNINPLYTEREVLHQLNDAQVKVVFCLSNVALALSKVVSQTLVHRVVETDLFDFDAQPKAWLKNALVRHVKKMVPPHSFPKEIEKVPFREVLRLGKRDLRDVSWQSKLSAAERSLKTDQVGFFQYTGGTTGGSKGAMLTHYGLTSNVISGFFSGLQDLKNRDQGPLVNGAHGWIALPLPLYHIYSLHCFFLFGVAKGLGVALIPNPRDLNAFMKVLVSRVFDVMPGIQTLFIALMNRPDFAEAHFERVYTLSAGMGLSPEVYADWEKKVGKTLIEGFGLTESSPVLTFNPLRATKPGSAGLPIGGTMLKLRDPQSGADLPLGDPKVTGEILAKGPQIMRGYLRRDQETRAMITEDGWLRTGDLGMIDEKGYLHIVGRIKEMMIVSGFNVYPDELETVALSTHAIIEAAAVSVPDSQTGEKIVIYCVPRVDPQLSEEEQLQKIRATLVQTFQNSLTGYKRPREVRFCASLPKSPIGKILRRLVKDRAMSEQGDAGSSQALSIGPGF